MKKTNFWDKLRYSFDNLMSKGTLSLILLLAAITAGIIVIAGIVAACLNGGEFGNAFEMMWVSLMHTLDAGTIAGDETSNIGFIIVMSVVTLCGIFVTSMLIGVIGAGLEEKMESLRKGHSLVIEKNHVIILGFNENAINIIRELIMANENQKKGVIVVMDSKDKTEMEDTISQRIPQTKTTHIICRSGNIDNISDIEICSPATCRSIIVNADDDFMSIKAVLACTTVLEESDNADAYITALIHSEQNAEAARIAGNGKAEIFYYQSSIARIMAHTCRQPGMSTVFNTLLSYEGDEIYVEQIPKVVGKSMAEVNMYFDKSTAIGIVRNGEPMLNPPADTKIDAADKIVFIAEDDDTTVPLAQPAAAKAELFADKKDDTAVARNTLILGNNDLLGQVITEMDCYSAKGSVITIASEKIDKEFVPKQRGLKNIKLDVQECNIFERAELEKLVSEKPDNILILTDSSDADDEADSKTLLLLLHIRDIARKNDFHFTVTSEMRSVENQELAQVTKVTDFIISSNITALMMAQISQTREQFVILDDLLSDSGSELYMKNASRYVKTDVPVDFYTVCASAVRYGEIAIGYKKVLAEGKFEIVINPLKSKEITLSKEDSLILVAED